MYLRCATETGCRAGAFIAGFVALWFMTSSTPAVAGLFSTSIPDRATSMIEGAHRAAPRAYYRMCERQPALCALDQHRASEPAAQMTEPLWRMVLTVNEEINDRVEERDDLRLFGVSDFWTAAQRFGDCEDYVIAKKQTLVARGIAPENLLYAVSRNRWDAGYHAVLILRTTDGDYVLDNMRDRVLPWEDTRYDFVMRQAAHEAMAWVAVSPQGQPPEQVLSLLQ